MIARRLRLTAIGLAVALAAGCGDDTNTAPIATPTTPTISTPVTLTFTGVVGPGGTSSRTFAPQMPGPASATVSAISPPTALGIGLGVPRADGTGCLHSRTAIANDGGSAQVATAVDTGTFCVQVFAPAQSAPQVSFSVTLVYP